MLVARATGTGWKRVVDFSEAIRTARASDRSPEVGFAPVNFHIAQLMPNSVFAFCGAFMNGAHQGHIAECLVLGRPRRFRPVQTRVLLIAYSLPDKRCAAAS